MTLDVVKLDMPSDDYIVQKFMSENKWELKLGSQLVVNESQEAIFVKGGIALDVFTAGTHTLVSQNLPLLTRLLKLPYNDTTPFTAEVWFVNRTAKRNLRWGTPHRISVIEPTLGYPINIGACGQWGFRIEDSRSFVRQLVGAQMGANSQRIHACFIGEILEKFGQLMGVIFKEGNTFFEVSSRLDELSQLMIESISPEFERFGIEIVNFTITNINIAPNEMKQIQAVMGKKMEMRQLSEENVGNGYLTSKSFEVISEVAKNHGAAGTVVGALAGLGIGQNVIASMGQSVTTATSREGSDAESRLVRLKSLLDKGLMSKEEYEAKRMSIIEKL